MTDFLDGDPALELDQRSALGEILDRWPTGSTSSRWWSVWRYLLGVIPWWFALILPLRDALLWGLVPFLRTRGYSALPVHFLGKAATFNLLYAFPLLLGDGHGAVAILARVFGWAFAIWGVALYWWVGRPLRLPGLQAAARRRAASAGASCLTRPTSPCPTT